MLRNFIRVVLILAGAAIGPGLVAVAFEVMRQFSMLDPYVTLQPWVTLILFIVSALISGIIFIFISKRVMRWMDRFTANVEENVSRIPARTVLSGSTGLIFGLLVAFLLSWPLSAIPVRWLSVPITVIVYLLCAALGMRIAVKNAPRVLAYFKEVRRHHKEPDAPAQACAMPKILDTSVIIDGRIFDILKTGIIEGTIVIPEFVLGELRHIADSADALKRTKGRRGLDILSKIQKELNLPVQITAQDYEDVAEVDAKLLRMAQEMGGKVITNDFNLNKVAAVQSVPILNINDLSNAVKPVLLPGEQFTASIIKEGKEHGQGVAYLDDGTMIVVENGREHIGRTAGVVVTSVLQTSAGRMIFAKIA